MMEKLFSQFQFDPVPFREYGPDGQTTMVELSNADIDTDGEGFDFTFDHDPSFGDDQVQRRQFLAYLEAAYRYEEWRRTSGDPTTPRADIAEIFRKLSLSFGWSETGQVLKRPDGVVLPGEEFNIMLAGGDVDPNPNEDLILHLIEHLIQRQSPLLQQGLESGKIKPEVVEVLDEHIQETMNVIQRIVQDPQAAAQAKIQAGLMVNGGEQRAEQQGAGAGNA